MWNIALHWAGTVAASAIGVAVVGVVLARLLDTPIQRRLERLRSELASDSNERTERLKSELASTAAARTEVLRHELADDLAARTRRADYLRGQIERLYGPLAFFIESSARHIDTNNAILRGYDEYFKDRDTSDLVELGKEMDEVIATANRYVGRVVENNKETIGVAPAETGHIKPLG